MKLCFLTIMPSPYMEDCFAALHRDSEIELRVLYQEMTAPDTHWGTQSLPSYASVMKGRWYPFLGGRLHHNPTVTEELAAAAADLYIVQGYAGITSQRAFQWLRKHRKRWVFWGERPGMRSSGLMRNLLRDRALKPVLAGADAIAAIGSLAVSAYKDRLKREIPVVNLPYLCDVQPFQQASDDRPPLRHAQGTGESPVTILYCGQLIERKGLDTLLTAFQQLRAAGGNVRLQLVGTGPLETSLKQSVSSANAAFVDFAGFRPVGELPRLFAGADLFVLPSRHDGWGVVVNQALAAGLPLICSEAVGAAHDLIREGWNGYRFAPGDHPALADRLQELIENADRRQQMSHNSRKFSDSWTPETGVALWKELADQLVTVPGAALETPSPSVSP
jgi:glycosyltransferase involved in cell wall biosynthesis